MKKNLRFAVASFWILALLFAAFPVLAETNKTVVTGTVSFLGEPYEVPDNRTWETGGLNSYIFHWRNDYLEFRIVTNDPRLNGVQKSILDGEYFANKSGVFMHIWGKGTIYTGMGFTIPAWECSSNEILDLIAGTGSVKVVCQGIGDNQGLVTKFTLVQISDTDYQLEGVIIEPDSE